VNGPYNYAGVYHTLSIANDGYAIQTPA